MLSASWCCCGGGVHLPDVGAGQPQRQLSRPLLVLCLPHRHLDRRSTCIHSDGRGLHSIMYTASLFMHCCCNCKLQKWAQMAARKHVFSRHIRRGHVNIT
jgi:hypothetical protein